MHMAEKRKQILSRRQAMGAGLAIYTMPRLGPETRRPKGPAGNISSQWSQKENPIVRGSGPNILMIMADHVNVKDFSHLFGKDFSHRFGKQFSHFSVRRK